MISVRAVVGPPEQRCWVERQQVVEDRGNANVGGAIVGALIGGVLGHQIGGGRGRDVATAGGAVAGAAIGSNAGGGGRGCVRAGRPEVRHGTERTAPILGRDLQFQGCGTQSANAGAPGQDDHGQRQR